MSGRALADNPGYRMAVLGAMGEILTSLRDAVHYMSYGQEYEQSMPNSWSVRTVSDEGYVSVRFAHDGFPQLHEAVVTLLQFYSFQVVQEKSELQIYVNLS